jgi:HSP20 family molecular chaperone IbpA
MNKKVIGLMLVLAGLTNSTAVNRTIFFDADNFFNTFFEKADRNTIQSPTIKEISKPGADRYVYQLNVPGFAEEDLEIKFNETLNLISISAKNSSQTDIDDTDNEGEIRHTHSSSSQSFSTSFTAPSDALLNSLEYSVDKGQVTLIMEKIAPTIKKGWQSVTAKKIKA